MCPGQRSLLSCEKGLFIGIWGRLPNYKPVWYVDSVDMDVRAEHANLQLWGLLPQAM